MLHVDKAPKHAKSKKPDTNVCTTYNSICLKYPDQANLQSQKKDWWLSGAEEKEKEGAIA